MLENYTRKQVDIKQLKNNTGQIKGLPKNPRVLKDDKYSQLVISLKEDPDMLELREVIAYDIGKSLVVVAGNMRVLASKEAGINKLPVKILPTSTTVEKLKRIVIKDNLAYGDWSFDDLANEWDIDELLAFGMDEASLKTGVGLANIDDVNLDWDSLEVMVVNPPEAPRLKERFELNFSDMKEYEEFKAKYKDNPKQLLKDLKL